MRTCSLGGDAAQHPGDEVECLLDVDGVFPLGVGMAHGG